MPTALSGAEATRSVPESPFGLMTESASADYHALRQGFSPPTADDKKRIQEVGGWVDLSEDRTIKNMKKRLAIIIIRIVILLLALPIIFLTIDIFTDIFPESKYIRLKQSMVSSFWEQRGVHNRTCKHIQWSFVAIADYESAELLQHYEEKWNQKPKPAHPALELSEYQGRFFAIFSFITSKFELSMEKYLGYSTKIIPLKDYSIGNHLYICRLEDWYE